MNIRKDLSKKTIDEMFEKAKTQGDYIVGIYAAVVPNWDKVDKMDHFPMITAETSKYIFEKAIEFDKKNCPNVIPGGGWLNGGLSTLNNFEVLIDTDRITYKEEK